MTLEGILLGLLALVVGLAFCFGGFRWFLILLPIWAFFAGFIFGAGAVTTLFGDQFVATILSWVAGLAIGIGFALISYLYYWFAVIFLGASIGYFAGLGIMAWLGNEGGLLATTVGLVVAVVFAIVFVVLRVPRYLVLLATAFAGAFAIVSGVALILGRVPVAALQFGPAGLYVRDNLSWVWVAAAIVLGFVGYFAQARSVARAEMALYADYRNPGMSSDPMA